MSERSFKLCALAAVLFLAAVLVLLFQPSVSSSPNNPPSSTTPLGSGAAFDAALSQSPIGLSIEYSLLSSDLGTKTCPSPAFVKAMQALGDPPVRIGGDSQDVTAPTGASGPGIQFVIPAGFWARLHCLLQQTHQDITVGINLKTGTPAWAAQIANEARGAIPTGQLSFSIGNEPDLYGILSSWLSNGRLISTPMPMSAYVQEFNALRAQLGGAPIVGLDFAIATWSAHFAYYAQTLGLSALDIHAYPISHNNHRPMTTAVLANAKSGSFADNVRYAVVAAHQDHLPAIISESNSITSHGQSGISNSPISAVWAVRFTLRALQDGFAQVRFHSSAGPYDPFRVSGSRVIHRPIFVGLEALAAWIPAGAQLASEHSPKRALLITAIGKERTIFDNVSSKSVSVSIRATRSTVAQELGATRVGLHSLRLVVHRRKLLLTVPSQTIIAIAGIHPPLH